MKMKLTGCGLWIGLATISTVIGGYATNYILSWFEKDIPMIFDCLIGLIGGSLTIPVATVGWILKTLSVF